MKMFAKAIIAAGICAASMSAVSTASAAEMRWQGEITTPACNITGLNLNFDFGSVNAAAFNTAGARGSWVSEQRAEVTECPASVANAKVTLTGTPDAVNPQYWANTGTAQGFSAVFFNSLDGRAPSNDGSAPGSLIYVPIWSSSHASSSIRIGGRLISTTGAVTPGTINIPVTMNFEYN